MRDASGTHSLFSPCLCCCLRTGSYEPPASTTRAAVQRVPQVSGCSGKTRRHPARCQMRRVLLVDLQELIAGGRKLVLIGARCEGQRRSSKLEVAQRARCESGRATDVQNVTSTCALREVEQQQTTFSGGRQQKQLRREANGSIRRPPASPSKLRNSIASPRSCRSSSARARSITKRLFHKSFGIKTPPGDLPHDYQLCTSPRASKKVSGPGKQSRHGWWKTNNRANIIAREHRSNSRLCSPAGEYHRSQ